MRLFLVIAGALPADVLPPARIERVLVPASCGAWAAPGAGDPPAAACDLAASRALGSAIADHPDRLYSRVRVPYSAAVKSGTHISVLIACAALVASVAAPTAAWAGEPPVSKPAVSLPRVLSKLEAPYPEGATGEAVVVLDVTLDVAGIVKELRLVE